MEGRAHCFFDAFSALFAGYIPYPAETKIQPDAAKPSKAESFHLIERSQQMLKPSITKQRLQEIDGLQGNIKQLGAQYKKDFPAPSDISSSLEKDLKTAGDFLD